MLAVRAERWIPRALLHETPASRLHVALDPAVRDVNTGAKVEFVWDTATKI